MQDNVVYSLHKNINTLMKLSKQVDSEIFFYRGKEKHIEDKLKFNFLFLNK